VRHAFSENLLLESRGHLLEESVLVVENIVNRLSVGLLHLLEAVIVHLIGDLLLSNNSVNRSQVVLDLVGPCFGHHSLGGLLFERHHTVLDQGEETRAKENNDHTVHLLEGGAVSTDVTVPDGGHGGAREVVGLNVESLGGFIVHIWREDFFLDVFLHYFGVLQNGLALFFFTL